jgi:putative oxidoreductase
MKTMKAVRLFEFGGPEKLLYGDYPMPDVGPTDVLVKVLATSVSRWDIKYRTGEVHEFYGKSTGHHGGIQGRRVFPMPMQLGRDAAGEVVAVGTSVTTLVPGDRVFGMTNPENPLSLASIRGLGNLSGGVDLPGHTMFGGYAQFVSVRKTSGSRPAQISISIRLPPPCGRARPPTASSSIDSACG